MFPFVFFLFLFFDRFFVLRSCVRRCVFVVVVVVVVVVVFWFRFVRLWR